MRKVLYIAPLTALVLGGFASEASGQTATATASFQVTAINEISVSGNPGALVIDSRADINAGVTDATTTWGVTTNVASTAPVKVTGGIDVAMPTNVSLAVSLAAPTANGVSAGSVALSTVAANLVTGMSQLNETGLGVTYKLTATESAAVVSDSRLVTYTITGDV